jgi:hypothetical protein
MALPKLFQQLQEFISRRVICLPQDRDDIAGDIDLVTFKISKRHTCPLQEINSILLLGEMETIN